MKDSGNFQEAVIVDNAFHRRLSGMRNSQTLQNHPDIETMKLEWQQTQRRALYQMPVVAERPEEPSETKYSVAQDPTATVHNFHNVMRQLQKESKRSIKYQRPLSVFIITFHQLPMISKKYGRSAAEAALKFVADSLSQFIDVDIDVVGRFSEDRFIAILPEVPGANATLVAEQMRTFFEKARVRHNRCSFPVRASIGIACMMQHGTDWKTLIAKADLAADGIARRGGNAFGFGR